MRYKNGSRREVNLFPVSLEDSISDDHIARFYDAFVESLDLEALKIKIDSDLIKKVGSPAYYPKAMIKLILYGYSYGETSSRRLERAACENISFIWLMGGLKPSYRTIARFRRNNTVVLKDLLKESAKLCVKIGLVRGQVFFLDGTKIRANAGIDEHHDVEFLEKKLLEIDVEIDKWIKKIFEQAKANDRNERGLGSYVGENKVLQDKLKLKAKIEKALAKVKSEEKPAKSVNLVDNDCVKISGRQGTHSGYNMQIVTDDKHGLIVQSDVVAESNDKNQFSKQITEANKTVGGTCKASVSDNGYYNIGDIKKFVEETGIKVIIPNAKQAEEDKKRGKNKESQDKRFDKEKFIYDKEADTYTCPAGRILKRVQYRKEKKSSIYKTSSSGEECKTCEYFKECAKGNQCRSIWRNDNAEFIESLSNVYTENQEIYKERKCKVELQFGFIKRNLKYPSFLLRGLEGVKAEASILGTCFNTKRMIKIIGLKPLIEMLKAIGNEIKRDFCQPFVFKNRFSLAFNHF